jgi:hypothetical protein
MVDGATMKNKTHLATLSKYCCSFPYIMSFFARSLNVFRNSFAVDTTHHPTPTPCFALLTADNQIGDEGAAAVAGALEPRRNGDGSWTPSTALTWLGLGSEWPPILMVVQRKAEAARVYPLLAVQTFFHHFSSPSLDAIETDHSRLAVMFVV